MQCPRCRYPSTKVIRTTKLDALKMTIRVRVCSQCDFTFETKEKMADEQAVEIQIARPDREKRRG